VDLASEHFVDLPELIVLADELCFGSRLVRGCSRRSAAIRSRSGCCVYTHERETPARLAIGYPPDLVVPAPDIAVAQSERLTDAHPGLSQQSNQELVAKVSARCDDALHVVSLSVRGSGG
jgi:hypothetical protein